MCGFVVWYNKKNKVDPFKLEKAIQLQNYRGPDFQSRIYFDKNLKKTEKNSKIRIGFTHNRLSIIDLSKNSHQPYIGKDKKNCLVYNGEIYNYLELKKQLINNGEKIHTSGDTEILYKILLNNNKNFVDKINGMWAFVFFSIKKKELIISRDIVGQKPLYYYRDNDNLIISTEPKSIFFILFKSGKRKVNEDYLLSFFNTGRLKINIPFYKSIKKAEPGSVLLFDLNKNKLSPYQKFQNINKNFHSDFINNVNNLEKDISKSVERCLRSDRKIALLLSGGVDSSIIGTFALKYTSKLSFYSAYSDDKYLDKTSKNDMYYASYLSKKLGVKLIKVEIDKKKNLNIDFLKSMAKIFEFPVSTVGSAIALNLIYKRISQDGIKVILSGTGGDEIFGGYLKFIVGNLRKSFLNKNPIKILNAYKDYIFYDLFDANKHLYNSFKALVKILIKGDLYNFNIFNNYLKLPFKKEFLNSEKINKFEPGNLIEMQKYEIYQNHLQRFMFENDSNSMMYSTEARSPFLDANLLKYVNIKTKNKFRNGYNKILLRKVLSKYDEKCAWRKEKTGVWINTNRLFKDNFKDIKDILHSSKIINKYLDIDSAIKIKNKRTLLSCLPIACLEDTYDLYD